jgi:hypothetical protein
VPATSARPALAAPLSARRLQPHACRAGHERNCIATYPGDFARALIALDADVLTISPQGDRAIKCSELHIEPADQPNIESTLGLWRADPGLPGSGRSMDAALGLREGA